MNWGDGELVFTPLPIALRISGLRISHSLVQLLTVLVKDVIRNIDNFVLV